MIILFGWVQTSGTHAVTQALVATGVAGRRHHEAFHRFFSRGTWCPDAVGRLLLTQILRWVPQEASIGLVLDDTLAPKEGPKVFGIGNHLDAVRSTRRVRIFTFGHVWVVLSVVVQGLAGAVSAVSHQERVRSSAHEAPQEDGAGAGDAGHRCAVAR
jgi:hypothetical protein